MKDKSVVRLGVIGEGNIARQHIANISSAAVQDCRVTAICSRRPSDLATELGAAHFSDYQELIASGLCDAVLIATPTFNHFTHGAAALQAGLHVMMEKPVGMSLKEGQDLLSLQQHGQVFAAMLNQRADPLFLKMREIIASGALGEITRTHWTMTNWFRPEVYFQVSDWRATWRGEGGGLLLNQCIHNLDIFQWLCGMPELVRGFCRMGRYHDIEVEDEATAYFEYANGASGVFMGSTGEAPGVNRFDVIGDQGSLQFDGQRLQFTQLETATSEFSRTTRDMFGMPESRIADVTPERAVNQHARLMNNFCAAILHGEELLAPASQGLNSLALANAILLSSWEDTAIALPLDSDRYQRALAVKLEHSRLRVKADIAARVDMDASYR